MNELSYTLLSDGSSDRMLMPAIDWLLGSHVEIPFAGEWADLRAMPRPPKGLGDRIRAALLLHPCDLLFVHRDAEKATRAARLDEIDAALGPGVVAPWVPVIPVRMQEAWFLFDEAAIREAARNPSGRLELSLPPLNKVEAIADAKTLLGEKLQSASELRGRRLARLNLGRAKHRLATLISDFSPLRQVPAFAALEKDLLSVLIAKRWSRLS